MSRAALRITAAVWAGLAAAAHADVVGYWDYNGQTLSPSVGTGTQTVVLDGLTIGGSTDYVAGTTVNAVGATPAGDALRAYNLVGLASEARLTFSGLNFTNLYDGAFSFAIRSNAVFQVGEELWAEYSTDGSTYTDLGSLALPTSTWSARSFSLPDDTDNQPNVRVRVRFGTVFDLGEEVSFDNVQVTAVPEPGTALLLAGGAWWGLRRRRRSAAAS